MEKTKAYFREKNGQIEVHFLIAEKFKTKKNGRLVNLDGVPHIGTYPTVTAALAAAKTKAQALGLTLDLSNIVDVLY